MNRTGPTPGLPSTANDHRSPREEELSLADIPLQQEVELVRIDLPVDQLEPLLERGMLPGCRICPVWRSPFGDPIVMLDGTLLALRREMAACLCVKRAAPALD